MAAFQTLFCRSRSISARSFDVAPWTDSADALGSFAQLLPDDERRLFAEHELAQATAIALMSRFSIGRNWLDVDTDPGHEDRAWRSIDPQAMRDLARNWLAAGAPVPRITELLAIALLKLTARTVRRAIAIELRRQRRTRFALHASCGGLLFVLVASTALLHVSGVETHAVPEGASLAAAAVWIVAALFANRQKRQFDGQTSAFVGLFVRRVEQAAAQLEDRRSPPLAVMRRLRAFDERGRLPDEIWQLMGIPDMARSGSHPPSDKRRI